MHYSMGLKVPLGELPATYISCQRPRTQGPFDAREGLIYETLLPHLQRALALHLEFTEMRSRSQSLETALDAFEHAVFGVSRERKVVLSSGAAAALARARDGLCLRARGTLSCVLPAESKQLQALVSAAVATGSGAGIAAGGSLLVHRRTKSPLRVTITPFYGTLSGTTAQVAALVFVSDPAARPQSRGSTLRLLYALTPTESRVADLLLKGLEVREVANAMRITLNTARFHTKRVLAKTGARRQTELMRLMLSLPQAGSDAGAVQPI
jgi:DNA-binding CsgD family transcriptional regulator